MLLCFRKPNDSAHYQACADDVPKRYGFIEYQRRKQQDENKARAFEHIGRGKLYAFENLLPNDGVDAKHGNHNRKTEKIL